MNNQQIAIELIRIWCSQPGLPASIDTILNNYKKVLEELENE